MKMKEKFEFTKDERGIGTLTFDTPESSANVFTQSALEEFETQLDALLKDSESATKLSLYI